MALRRTIPIRTELNENIFDEMTKKYPKNSVDGKEYKQNCSFMSLPSDFDFAKFSDDCKDADIDIGKAIAVLMYMLVQMADTNGYYIILNRSFIRVMTSSFQFCSYEYMEKIIAFLDVAHYIYRFDEKITATYAVRTFETVQAARISNRTRKEPKPIPESRFAPSFEGEKDPLDEPAGDAPLF